MENSRRAGKSGVMLAGERAPPSSKGARVRFSGTKRTVIDDLYRVKELIGGFCCGRLIKEEAIEGQAVPEPL